MDHDDYIPKIADLGPMVPLEVYLYCDGPKLFSCVTETGQIYLGLWVNKTVNGDRWLYSPLDRDEHAQLTLGKRPVFDIILNARAGFAYDIEGFDGHCETRRMQCGDISHDILPDDDVLLRSA